MKIMQRTDSKYFDISFQIGEENEWHQRDFKKFDVYQGDDTVFEVVIYNTPDSTEEKEVSKKELKKMILDYWESLRH